MAFNVEISPRRDRATGMTVHTVALAIDDHETVLTFESKEHAEAFARVERARLTEKETKAPKGRRDRLRKRAR